MVNTFSFGGSGKPDTLRLSREAKRTPKFRGKYGVSIALYGYPVFLIFPFMFDALAVMLAVVMFFHGSFSIATVYFWWSEFVTPDEEPGDLDFAVAGFFLASGFLSFGFLFLMVLA